MITKPRLQLRESTTNNHGVYDGLHKMARLFFFLLFCFCFLFFRCFLVCFRLFSFFFDFLSMYGFFILVVFDCLSYQVFSSLDSVSIFVRSFFKTFFNFFFLAFPPDFSRFYVSLFLYVRVYSLYEVRTWYAFIFEPSSAQTIKSHPVPLASMLSSIYHSTAQRNQPCTKQRSTYVPIRARQRKQADRVSKNQHKEIEICQAGQKMLRPRAAGDDA